MISAFWVHCGGKTCKWTLLLWPYTAGKQAGLGPALCPGVAVLLGKKKLTPLLRREVRRSFPVWRQPWHRHMWTERGRQPGLVTSVLRTFLQLGTFQLFLLGGQLCLERKDVPADCAEGLLAKRDTVCFCPHCRNLTCGCLEAATGRTEFRAR